MSVSFGIVCSECDGTGESECDACEGSGMRIVNCGLCEGLRKSCRACHGTGKIELQCDECEDGMTPCSNCDGPLE